MEDCDMRQRVFEVGQVYGKLTLIEAYVRKDKSYQYFHLFRCECGKITEVRGGDVRSSHTTSCGCYFIQASRDRSTTHGHSRSNAETTGEYKSWSDMRQRCTNPNNKYFHRYGGRGITICDRWLNSFENFLEDMGLKPAKGYHIDRIDNDKGYFKENCQWLSPSENAKKSHLQRKGKNK